MNYLPRRGDAVLVTASATGILPAGSTHYLKYDAVRVRGDWIAFGYGSVKVKVLWRAKGQGTHPCFGCGEALYCRFLSTCGGKACVEKLGDEARLREIREQEIYQDGKEFALAVAKKFARQTADRNYADDMIDWFRVEIELKLKEK